MVKIRMNLKMKVKMMISESSKIGCMVIIMLCNEIYIMSGHNCEVGKIKISYLSSYNNFIQ